MKQIIEQTINKAIKMLEACSCEFAIIDPDGNQHGDLEIVYGKKRAPSAFPHGELKAYVKDHIDGMNPGDVVSIPIGKYGFDSVQSSVSATACAMFGNGACTTTRVRENDTVQILRVF